MNSESPVFLSITAANLFLHNLALLGFLSSKVGFHGFKKKFPLTNAYPQPSHNQNKIYGVNKAPAIVNNAMKASKNNSGKLLVHNFSKVASKLLSIPKKTLPLFKDIKSVNANTISAEQGAIDTEPVYDIAYFNDWLLILASEYKDDKYFKLWIDCEFSKRYIKDPIVNENYNHLVYFLNTKNLETYAQLVKNYHLFSLSYLSMFESLAIHHYGPALEKEALRQSLMVELFQYCFKTQQFNTIGTEERNRLFSYWLVDYVFKLENVADLDTAIHNYNDAVKKLETLDFLKNIHPDIYQKVLQLEATNGFFLKPPVYQNPKFLEFLNLRASIDKFENKPFLFNLVSVYKDYCENQLYYSFGGEAEKTVEILKHLAETQYLTSQVIVVGKVGKEAKKIHKI